MIVRFFRLVSNNKTLYLLIIIFQIKYSLTAIWRYFRKSLFESNWRILQRRGFQVVTRRFDFPVHGKSYSKDRIRKCQVQKVFVSIVLHQSDFRMWTENGGGSFTIFAFRMQRHGWKGGQVRSCQYVQVSLNLIMSYKIFGSDWIPTCFEKLLWKKLIFI